MNLIQRFFVLFLLSGSIAFARHVGIIEGRDAKPGEFPYQVYIYQQGIEDWWFLCDGIILSPSWVLSAASCVNTSAPTYETIVGITNFEDTEASDANNQTISVTKFIVHPNYNSKTFENDLSLMKLSAPYEFNTYVQPATLAGPNTDSRSGTGIFSGWGAVGGFNPYPKNLQAQESNILSFQECNDTLQKIITDTTYDVHPDAIRALNDSTSICTGPLDDFKGSCFGDEGSPLSKDGVVIGVVSFIIEGCGREFAPTMFTRVSAYVDWIKANVDEDIIIAS